MKRSTSAYASLLGVACCALLHLAPAQAEDLLLDVKVRHGNFMIVSKSQATVPAGKETEVQAGSRYKLKVLATLMLTLDMVRLSVRVDDLETRQPHSVSVVTTMGKPVKLFYGRKGDEEVEITPQLKTVPEVPPNNSLQRP